MANWQDCQIRTKWNSEKGIPQKFRREIRRKSGDVVRSPFTTPGGINPYLMTRDSSNTDVSCSLPSLKDVHFSIM